MQSHLHMYLMQSHRDFKDICSTEIGKKNPKISYINPQKNLYSQSNPEKGQSWRHHTS